MASQGFVTLGNASNIMNILGAIVILVNQSVKHFGRSPRLETAERILEECEQFLENLQSSDIVRIQKTKPGFMESMRQSLQAAQRNLRSLRVQAAAQPGLLNELNFWSEISKNITLLLQNLEHLKAEIAQTTTSPRSSGRVRSTYVSSSSGLPIYNMPSEATSSRSRDLFGAANLPHTNLNAPPPSIPRQSETITVTARHRPQHAPPGEGTSIYVPSQPQKHDRSNQQLPSTNAQMRNNSSGDYPVPIQQRTSLNPVGQMQSHSLAGNYSNPNSQSSESQDDGRGFHPLFAPPPTSDAGPRLYQERTTHSTQSQAHSGRHNTIYRSGQQLPSTNNNFSGDSGPIQQRTSLNPIGQMQSHSLAGNYSSNPNSQSSESQDDGRGFHAPPFTSDAGPRLYQERTTHSTQSQTHSGRHNTIYRSGQQLPSTNNNSSGDSGPIRQRTSLNPIGQMQSHSLAGNHSSNTNVSSQSPESQDDGRGFHPLFAPPPTSDAGPQERTTHSTQSQAHSGRHNTIYRSGNTQPQYQPTSDLPISVSLSGESTPRPHLTGSTSSSEFYINPQMYTSSHARGKNQSASQNVSSPQTHLSPQNFATSGLGKRSPSREPRPPLASSLNQASSQLQDIERGVANLGLHPQTNPAAPEANPSHSNRRSSSYISSTTMQPTAGTARPTSQYDGNWNSNISPRDNPNSSTGIPVLRRQTSAQAGSRFSQPPQPISRLSSSDRTQGNHPNTYNGQPNPRAQQGSYSGDYSQSTPWPPRR